MHEILPPHDHRRLGRELDLFALPERAAGQVFWKPRGLVIWRALERMLEAELDARGYQQVRSPLLWSQDLWRQSGHAAKFADDMVYADLHGHPMSLKPMSCPAHCELFRERPRSYRELPLRLAEFGHCHRAEQSGELHGLLDEVQHCLHLALAVYERFGFQPQVELSLRPELRFGDDRRWDEAEAQLRDALQGAGVPHREVPGEGAFYGPKIDMQMLDRLGRRWQLGTVQIDHVLPSAERFDLRHVAAGGGEQPVVLIHRALFGSFERFIALLLEQFEGWLPVWLAPVQAAVLPVGESHAGWAAQVYEQLRAAGVRAEVLADGPLGARIRRARMERVPYLLVGGDSEARSGSVAVRPGRDTDAQSMPIEDAVELLRSAGTGGRLP